MPNLPHERPQGPKLRRKLLDTFAKWRAMMRDLDMERCGGETAYSHIVQAFENAIGLLDLKFGFVYVLPWRVWECRHRACAIECRELYRREVLTSEGKRRMHRVAHTFFSYDSGDPELKRDMEAHCDGSPITDTLHQALLGYESIMLDGTWAEGIHRDVQSVSTHAPAAEYAYQASSTRLAHNLQVHEQ